MKEEKENIVQLFGKEKLEELQQRIAAVSGYSVCIIDFQGNKVVEEASKNAYCKESCPLREDCGKHYAMNAAKNFINEETQIFVCANGLYHFSIPIFIEHAYYGSVIAGKILCEDKEKLECAEFYQEKEQSEELLAHTQKDFAEHIYAVKDLVTFMVKEMVENVRYKKEILELEHMSVHLQKIRKRNHVLKNSMNHMERFNLRNRIMPESLLNYLVAISSMATLEGAKQTENMVQNGIAIFRYYLDQKEEMVFLGQELAQLRFYLEIMEVQYKDCFSYEILLEPDMENKVAVPIFGFFVFLEHIMDHAMFPSRFQGKFCVIGKEESEYYLIRFEYVTTKDTMLQDGDKAERIMDETELVNQIRNTVRRYELVFGEACEISMTNACAEIKIGKYK